MVSTSKRKNKRRCESPTASIESNGSDTCSSTEFTDDSSITSSNDETHDLLATTTTIASSSSSSSLASTNGLIGHYTATRTVNGNTDGYMNGTGNGTHCVTCSSVMLDMSKTTSNDIMATSATCATTTTTSSSKDSFKSSTIHGSSSVKQSLLLSTFMLGLGISIGVTYVGWVQRKYGFGKNPVMERRYLPLGPATAESSMCVTPASNHKKTEGKNSNQWTKIFKKKGTRLHRDNPNRLQHATTKKSPLFISTLFGIEYDDHLVNQPERNIDDGDNDTVEHNEHVTTEESNRQIAAKYGISSEWYHLASTARSVSLVSSESTMTREVAARVHQEIPDLLERATQVSWGGPHNSHEFPETNWWYPSVPASAAGGALAAAVDLDQLEGGHLLYAYLFIMKWNPNPHFPFRLCGEKGCPPERAISHTLEWREKYRPWVVPPSVIAENSKGYVYHRGFSPSHAGAGDTVNNEAASGKHATVWLRLGHKVKNDLAFFRGILNAADRAIAESLKESKGQVGKYNVIFDCAGFSLSNTPTLHTLKQAVTMLQDHYPNRLGMIYLAHLSRPGEVFLKVVLRLITKEVRDKIKVLPDRDEAKRMAILRMVVEEESIPVWLGGSDAYQFSVEDHYPEHHRCTEEEAQEFLTTMPYHAK